MNYKEFFTTDNRSGWKTCEDKLKRNFPEIWKEIDDYINHYNELLVLNYKEKVYCFINQIKTPPTCKHCPNITKIKGSISDGFIKTCDAKHVFQDPQPKEKPIKKRKPTLAERYNVQHYLETKDFKEFFKKNNGSGWKTREYTLKKNAPEIYNMVKEFANKYGFNNLTIKEQIWYFINKKTEKICCEGCGNDVNFRDTINKGYHQYCSLECANKNGNLATKAANALEKKYGVKYFSQHDSWGIKVKQTKLERYGNENYVNTELSQQRRKENYTGRTEYQHNIIHRQNTIEKLQKLTIDKIIKFDLTDKEITLRCSFCNNDYLIGRSSFERRVENCVKPCTICNPLKDTNSIQEKELTEYVISQIGESNVIDNTKKVLKSGLELDIYIPDNKLAIEFNGCHYHSDKYVENDYHFNKTNECNDLGIQLLHVFEDEWKFKRDIVKSLIKRSLNLNTNYILTDKNYVKLITKESANKFLNENHIHGYFKCDINLGLFDGNEIISVLSLSKKKLSYDIVRFADIINYNIINSLKYFIEYIIKNISNNNINLLLDRTYFKSDEYIQNNFYFKETLKPDFKFFYNKKRYSKNIYKKSKLIRKGFDKNKTVTQLTKEKNIFKVYDSGIDVFVLKKNGC